MRLNILEHNIEHINQCPACESKKRECISSVYSESDELNCFETSYCLHCGLVYRSIRPNLKWFLNAWEKREVFQTNNSINPINEIIEEERWNRYNNILSDIEEFITFDSVIDLGCGTGTGLLAFSEKGKSVTGIEPDISRAKYGVAKGVNIINTTIEEIDSSSVSSVDLAMSIHSLEHFHNMNEAIILLKELVKEDGYVYIEVPDFMSYVTDANDSLYLGHLYNFSADSLIEAGLSNGLIPKVLMYPRSRPGGEANLAILFQRGVGSEGMDLKYFKPSLSDVLVRYASGIANIDFLTWPMQINIPEINDVSMAWKPDSKVTRTIQETNAKRTFTCAKEFVKVESQELVTENKYYIPLTEKLQTLKIVMNA
jgi:SAM-dependent methyltransferase